MVFLIVLVITFCLLLLYDLLLDNLFLLPKKTEEPFRFFVYDTEPNKWHASSNPLMALETRILLILRKKIFKKYRSHKIYCVCGHTYLERPHIKKVCTFSKKFDQSGKLLIALVGFNVKDEDRNSIEFVKPTILGCQRPVKDVSFWRLTDLFSCVSQVAEERDFVPTLKADDLFGDSRDTSRVLTFCI